MCKFCNLENFEKSFYDDLLEYESVSGNYVVVSVLFNTKYKKFFIHAWGEGEHLKIEMPFCFNCGRKLSE